MYGSLSACTVLAPHIKTPWKYLKRTGEFVWSPVSGCSLSDLNAATDLKQNQSIYWLSISNITDDITGFKYYMETLVSFSLLHISFSGLLIIFP